MSANIRKTANPSTGRPSKQPTRPPGTRPPNYRPPHHKPRPPVSHRPPGWGPHRPPYTRPPHFWEGHHYYTYHRYYYHPYRPYVFGPAWHPVGFFLSAVAATATVVAIDNTQYRYDAGVFYQPYNGGYQVVAPPAGAIVYNLPDGCTQVKAGDITYLQYNGDYYQPVRIDDQPAYEVVNIEE